MENNLDKHIDDKLKAAFDAVQKTAPAHLWENISQQLNENALSDNDLDEKVQDSFVNQLPRIAPAFLWDKIAADLDKDSPSDEVLDKKIQEGFLNQPLKKAPAFLWENISENLPSSEPVSDEVLDKKIQESFDKQPIAKAPNSIWNNINRQLNIDKTWNKINQDLDKQPVVSDWRKKMLQFMAAAAMLLLFAKTCEDPNKPAFNTVSNHHHLVENENENSTTIYEYHNSNLVKIENSNGDENQRNTDSENISTIIKEENKNSSNNTANTRKNTVNSTKKASKENVVSNQTNHKFVPLAKNSNKASNNDAKLDLAFQQDSKNTFENNQDNLLNNSFLSNNPLSENIENNAKEPVTNPINWGVLDLLKLGQIPTNNYTEPIQLLDEVKLENKNKKNLIANKLEVGAYVVVNSTMLINNDTREGFDKNSLVQNYFGLAANYGVWASYRILPKASLVAEFAINADNQQAYGVYDQGTFYIKEWVMKYNRISLAYKQDLWSTKSDKMLNTKFVAQAGLYLGFLREAKLFYNGDLYYDATGEHHLLDFGFKLALGQEISIDRFVIGYGIRSDIGVLNIFKGNAKITADDNPTNIIHLGGYLTLGYKF